MSNPPRLTLGESDAWPRWWGLARHRVVLGLIAPLLVADAVIRPGWRWWEWVAAGVASAAVAPGPEQRTGAEWSATAISFLLRRHVRWISFEVVHDALDVGAAGSQRVWCYEFEHRGRLDLSDHDAVLASRLARMVDSFAAAGVPAHVALHVERGRAPLAAARTSLTLTGAGAPPRDGRRRAAAGIPRDLVEGRTPVLERRHYVRTPGGVLCTLRVGDVAVGRASTALETLGRFGSDLTLSLHAGVVPLTRARRQSARAVHRVGAGAEFGRGAGFRWSAADQLGLDALREREELVARGVALCRWAIYVVVRAETVAQLRERVRTTRDDARAAGLRLEIGTGRQGQWYQWQLPGGPGW